jgi:hypothetical protein
MLFLVPLLILLFLIGFGIMSQVEGPEKPDSNPTPDEQKAEQEADPFIKDDFNAQASQLRFNKQCYLMDKVVDIVKSGARKNQFKWFSTVTGPPMDIANELISKKNINPLLGIKGHQYSLLVPRIRLFILEHTGKGYVEHELNFASDFGVGSIPGGNIEDIFKNGDMRGAGAGIKSFSYDLAGVNPAEADKLIDSTLVLYFQSLGDLFAPRTDGGHRFADLINYTQRSDQRAMNPKDFRIKAVVGWSEPEINKADRNNILPKDLRRAIVQAKTTLFLQLQDHSITFQENGNIEIEIKYMAALEQTLSSSSLDVFWIAQTAYLDSLESVNEGRVIKSLVARRAKLAGLRNKLKIASKDPKYSGLTEQQRVALVLAESLGSNYLNENVAIARYFSRNDVSAGGITTEEAIEGITREIEDKQTVGSALFDAATRNETFGGSGETGLAELTQNTKNIRGIDQQIEDYKEHIEETQQVIDKIKRRRRTLVYRRILDNLVGDPDNAAEKPGYVYRLAVSRAQIGAFGEEIGIANTQTTIEVREKVQAAKVGQPTKIISPADTAAQRNKKTEQLKKIAEAAAETGEDQSERVEELNEQLVNSINGQANDDNVYIDYFYFGDLLDILLEILWGDVLLEGGEKAKNEQAIESLEEFNILVGPIAIKDKKAKKKYITNISEIPISLDLFSQWFVEKVIKRQKSSYELDSIIRDMTADLIAAALGQGCYNDVKQKGKMAMLPVTAPSMEGGGSRIPKFGARCTLPEIRSRGAARLRPENHSNNISKLTNYLYFFIKDEDIKKRRVDEEKDNRDGVYHLRVGQDAGLVKKIQFNQTDIQFLKETRVTNDADTKDGYLRAKYDAKISMIGNSLFFPGQYVYVHPTVPGSQNSAITRNNLEKLGLGGYYLVTKVFHIISDAYYQTEITAQWHSYALPAGSQESILIPTTIGISNGKCKPGDPRRPETFDQEDAAKEGRENAKRMRVENTNKQLDKAQDYIAVASAANPLVGAIAIGGIELGQQIYGAIENGDSGDED